MLLGKSFELGYNRILQDVSYPFPIVYIKIRIISKTKGSLLCIAKDDNFR